MSEPIGPLDYVECIDASVSEPLARRQHNLILGRVYRVTDLCVSPPGHTDSGQVGLVIEGADPGANRFGEEKVGFLARRFKPIYRPKASLIQSLLSDTPTDIPVEA